MNMKPVLARITGFVLLTLGLLISPAGAGLVEEVDLALNLKDRPFGIVFEVVTGDSNALEKVMPGIVKSVEHIRRKAPDMNIAVVTHGKEQFALTRDNTGTHGKVHKQVQSLVKDAGVDIHVCGTYAEWHNKAPEDFPDYIEVSAAGPAQINDYRTLGYVVIQVSPGD